MTAVSRKVCKARPRKSAQMLAPSCAAALAAPVRDILATPRGGEGAVLRAQPGAPPRSDHSQGRATAKGKLSVDLGAAVCLDAWPRRGSARRVGGSSRPGGADFGSAGRVQPPPTPPDPPLP